MDTESFIRFLGIARSSGAIKASYEEGDMKMSVEFPNTIEGQGRSVEEFDAGQQQAPGGYEFRRPSFRAAAEVIK